MRALGLIPTATGEPAGKETGQKVTQIIAEGGRFDKAYTAFLARLYGPCSRDAYKHEFLEDRLIDQFMDFIPVP
jgi:hypothetical protein